MTKNPTPQIKIIFLIFQFSNHKYFLIYEISYLNVLNLDLHDMFQDLYYEIQNDRGLPHRFVKQFTNNFFKNLDCHKNYNLKYNWNFLHHKTLKTLKKYAINNPETVIIIKIKH